MTKLKKLAAKLKQKFVSLSAAKQSLLWFIGLYLISLLLYFGVMLLIHLCLFLLKSI